MTSSVMFCRPEECKNFSDTRVYKVYEGTNAVCDIGGVSGSGEKGNSRD